LDLSGKKKKKNLLKMPGGSVFNNSLNINRLMETVKFHNDTVTTHNLVVGQTDSVGINGREHLVWNVKIN
jgi:hypothetical protein